MSVIGGKADVAWTYRHVRFDPKQTSLALQGTDVIISRNTNILRPMHSNSLSSAPRKVKSSAHAISNPPRSGIIDPNNN